MLTRVNATTESRKIQVNVLMTNYKPQLQEEKEKNKIPKN